MQIKLMSVTGLDAAIEALRVSNRNYTLQEHDELLQDVRELTDYRGFVLPKAEHPNADYDKFMTSLQKVAKWGAGVGVSDYKDAGHDTILRYIDFTFATIGLHRGAQDDLDAHAGRFNTRIVRASTRTKSIFEEAEKSEWYQTRIRTVTDMCRATGVDIPESYTDDNGETWIFRNGGYINSKYINEKNINDYNRGYYNLSIPSDALWKVDLYDLRHIYMRRNQFTKASPELKIAIESLADQVEDAIPGDLGRLVRYDYAYDPRLGEDILVHVMGVRKTVDTTRILGE